MKRPWYAKVVGFIHHHVRHGDGFTLLETMVAISILLTALGGPFVVTQLGLRTARKAGQELVAANLAQEAVEFIRYRRDSNAAKGLDWLAGLSGAVDCIGAITDEPHTCVVDAIANVVYDNTALPAFLCGEQGNIFRCPFIKYDDDLALYGYDSGDDTIYRRAVHMQISRELNDVPVEVRVVAEVGWVDLESRRTIVLEEYITDWR